jgi:indole-3-glycerol phosphate synthase
MDILREIASRTVERIEEKRKSLPFERIKAMAEQLQGSEPKDGFAFEKALRTEGLSFICEIKKASPSKGVISEDFPYVQIAEEYEAAGADAISVLTEPFYFNGDDRHLSEISLAVPLPLLRKDFVVDPYMIYEAKLLVASAVLLICAILDERALAGCIEIAHGLGLSALVETHSEDEVRLALDVGARVIGVNNRDLRTFEVDISASERLRPLIPEGILFVSESGIQTPADVARLRGIGADAVLVGEAMMRSPDKAAYLRSLRDK